jgi:hypothetical protein
MSDPVNHPAHYTSHPSGIECITVTVLAREGSEIARRALEIPENE